MKIMRLIGPELKKCQMACWYETFYRGYDPALGRFQQVDPKATIAHDLTPYNYAGNNPVLFNDPLGDKLKTPPSWIDGEGENPYQNMGSGGGEMSSYQSLISGISPPPLPIF